MKLPRKSHDHEAQFSLDIEIKKKHDHYENTPIQLYWKVYRQKIKKFR